MSQLTSKEERQVTTIPFIYLQNQKFVVSEQAQVFLKGIKNPIGVFTIVGKYRTGKSLFLNRIMLNRSRAFKVSPTINSCTKGLWLWKDTIKLENQDQQKQILIIDTEGFGATQQSDAYNNKILLFALLLSSYFVYNSVGSIDQNSLNNISVIANLANQIQSKNSKDQNIEENFPSFLWLVRDFTLNLVDKNDIPIQAKQYLEQALQIQKGTSNQIQSKNRIRRMIRHFFKDRDCFTLVRPVQTEDQLQQLDTLEESQFRGSFLQQAKSLRQKILRKIKPKKLKNIQLNGQTLFQVAKDYVQVVNNNSLPNFQNSYRHLLKLDMANLKRRVNAQNQQKISALMRERFKSIQSLSQYEEMNRQFIHTIESSLKQRFRSHPSLSTVANSEQTASLISDIRSAALNTFQRHSAQLKKQMRHLYTQSLQEIKQDTLLSHPLELVNTQKQLKQYISSLQSSVFAKFTGKIPKFILKQLQDQVFSSYKQNMEDEFRQISTRKLNQSNNELRIKLQFKEQKVKEKQEIMLKMEKQLNEERKLRVEMEMRLVGVRKELQQKQKDLNKLERDVKRDIGQFGFKVKQLQNKEAMLLKQIQMRNQQHKTKQKTLQQKTTQYIMIDRELNVIKERLDSKTSQLSQKRCMIINLQQSLQQKSNKIQVQSNKIQELRESKEQLYKKYINDSEQMSARIINLQKTNSKQSAQIKELKRLQCKSQVQFAQHIKHLSLKCDISDKTCSELLQSNQKLQNSIQFYEQSIKDYHHKQDKYKQFKKCLKNSSSMQCLHCTRLFMSTIFLTHLSVCTAFKEVQGQGQKNCINEKTQFKVSSVVVDQNNGKPFTIYELQCQKSQKNWTIQKKFTQLCDFNSNLQNSLPGIELSSAKTIFDPKYLSKKSLSIEQKQFLIQKYFNDLSNNASVTNSKYWNQFITPKSQSQTPHKKLNTQRNALGQIKDTSNSTLNYQMKKSQIKDESTTKSVNNSQSLKRQIVHTPEQFFKIWQQKQLRTKASSVCLRKGKHQ